MMFGSLTLFVSKRRAKWLIASTAVTLIVASTAYWYYSVPRLNVILVTLDTTRADRLGVYDYQQGLTQGFDEFAKRGVVFERAYAPAPITLPSHTTMLTGLYPPEHGLRVNGAGRLATTIPLLPEILKHHGYDTGAFIAAVVLDSMYGLDRGFDTYDDDLSLSETRSLMDSDEHRREGQDVMNSAMSWLKKRTSRPFFCWIHLYDAHGPYDTRPALFGKRFAENPYDAGIAVEVSEFKRLLTFLKDRKLDKNTLIVVAGDHGEGLDDHTEIEHGMLVYNTTLRVPLVFVDPRHDQSGIRVSDAVSLVDLMPTVLDILRIPVPKHVSGRSLLAAMNGNAITSAACYAEAESPFDINRWCPLYTVITDRWKYIQTTRPELYDLENDPGELSNLAESNVDECERTRNVLEAKQESFVRVDPQKVELSEKDRANLGDLGYVTGGNKAAHAKKSDADVLPDIKDMLPYLAKYERARLIGLQGKLEETITLLREIVEVRNDFTAASVLLGDCLHRLNRMDEAAEAYRPVVDQRPDLARVRLSFAQALASQGHFEQAVAQFLEVVKQDPDRALPCFQLAEALLALQRFDEAIFQYREAIRIDPEFVLASVRLGDLLAKLERPADAAICFERAVGLEPKNTAARSGLLKVLLQMKEYGKAVQLAGQSVAVDPTSFEARFNLGSILAAQQRYEEAIAQYREAQKLRPDDPRPSQRIQQTEAAMNRAGKRDLLR